MKILNKNIWIGGRGFTLLELLVVIGIIGIIMALATVAYSTTQKSGRNSRRKQDLIAIQNSLEQYYAANTFVYPTTSCSDASTYLKSSWPIDPGDSSAYLGVTACTPTYYCICGVMEGTALVGNSAANCDYSGSKTHYCVSSLQ
jgi:prepilin-type N-terminal cleavage/methylation domain-containing protein